MAALSDREKHAIVTLLAKFERPAAVVVHMRNEFGVEIDRFQVRSYDPTNPRYEGGAKWRSIFDAARTAHLTSIEAIPIAHKAYRLNTLQRILEAAMGKGNWVLAASILRQAAREAGSVRCDRAEGIFPRIKSEARPEDQAARIARLAKIFDEGLQQRSAARVGETPSDDLKAA